MSSVYVDTSALGRVLLQESDAPAIRLGLNAFEQRVSSRLIQLELRRLGFRVGLPGRAETLLRDIGLLPVDDTVLLAAETIEPRTVAALDAVHLATACRLADSGEIDALMTFDGRLAEGARHHGLAVVPPA